MELFKEQVLMVIRRRVLLYLALSLSIAVLSGCSAKIFEEKNPEKVMKRYSKENLEDGGFYVKDGTGFFKPYKKESGFSTSASSSRIFWMEEKEEELIPVLYKGEVLSYVSSSSTPSKFSIERFKDCGYSVGIRGFLPVKNGQLLQYTASTSNLKEGSSAYELFNGINAQKLTVSDMNGSPVSEQSFTYGGVLAGLEQGKTYALGVYVGSFYKVHEVTADTRILASDSKVELDGISLTRNGYYAVQIPEGLESGYYYAEGYGFFKYVNREKHPSLKLSEIDWNQNLSTTSNDQGMEKTVNVTSEKTLDQDYESLHIKIQIRTAGRRIQSAQVVLPNGAKEEILEMDGITSHVIEPAVKGNYQVAFTGTGVKTDYQVLYEPIGEKKKEETAEEEAPKSSSSENVQNTNGYEWVMKMPEPLNEAEISDTQGAQ